MPERLTIPLRPKTRAGKVDRRYASRTEDMMQLEFTDEFLDFLDRHNGGVPATPNFKLGRNVKVVERFLCLVKDSKTNRSDSSTSAWSGRASKTGSTSSSCRSRPCFPVTSSASTSRSRMSRRWWVHDKSDEGAPHTVRVAKNFRAFVGMLFDASAPRSRRS